MFDLNSLISFFVLGVIGWYTYKIFIWPFYVSPLRKIPGPPTDGPLYGNFKRFFMDDEDKVALNWVEKYGSIVKYYGTFNRPTVLVADPKIISEMTTSGDFIKPIKMLNNLIAIAGNGVLMAEGESHKRQRKMMNPAFAHNNIKEMVPTFIRVASTLKKTIEDKTNAGESRINLTPCISKATLDIIGLVGFNYEFNSLTSSNELAEAYSSILSFPKKSLEIFLRMLSNIFPLARKIPIGYKAFNHSCEVIERVSNKLIEEKYHQDRNNKLEGKDLLSLLILTNKTLPPEEKMSDEELKNQIMTFLVAGHETTSVSTAWALYQLAQHPHEQDLLREELTKAFPDKSKFNPTYDEINSLEYLNCIVKETLRINSPVTFLSRTNIKDKVFGEYFIPKDSIISVAISTMHKLPSIWGPTADKFDPKRWLDPSLIKNASNVTYLPFFTGPRTCIGNKLALAEFKVLLATLIMNFDFKPVEGFKIGKRIFPVAKPHPHLELMVSKIED